MLQGWREAGERDLRARAREIVRQKLARYDFALDPAKSRALDAIYARAAEALR